MFVSNVGTTQPAETATTARKAFIETRAKTSPTARRAKVWAACCTRVCCLDGPAVFKAGFCLVCLSGSLQL